MRWRSVGVGTVLAVALAVLCQEAMIERVAGDEIGWDPYGVALTFVVVAVPVTQLWAGARGAGRGFWAGLVLVAAVTVLCAWQVAENVLWELSVIQVAAAGIAAIGQVAVSRTGRRLGSWTLAQAWIGSLACSVALVWGLTVWEEVRSHASLGVGEALVRAASILVAVIGCFVVAYLLVVRMRARRRRGWISTLVGGALCVGLAVVFSLWMHRLQPVPWSLAGVGPGSRSLMIARLPTGFDGCASAASARVVSRDPGHIRLQVRARPDRDCDVEFGPAARPLTVALTTPLHGEAIIGARRRATQPVAQYRHVGANATRQIYRVMPGVTGLRVSEARALLGAGAARAGAISIARGPRHNEVIAQSPAPGTLVGPDLGRRADHGWSRTPITLTTN